MGAAEKEKRDVARVVGSFAASGLGIGCSGGGVGGGERSRRGGPGKERMSPLLMGTGPSGSRMGKSGW